VFCCDGGGLGNEAQDSANGVLRQLRLSTALVGSWRLKGWRADLILCIRDYPSDHRSA